MNELWEKILGKLKAGETTLSSLLNDKSIVRHPKDVDAVLTELCRMASLSLIELIPFEDVDTFEKDVKVVFTGIGECYYRWFYGSEKFK